MREFRRLIRTSPYSTSSSPPPAAQSFGEHLSPNEGEANPEQINIRLNYINNSCAALLKANHEQIRRTMAKRKRSDMTSAQLEREQQHDQRRKLQSAIGGGYRPTEKPAPITLPKISILEPREWERDE